MQWMPILAALTLATSAAHAVCRWPSDAEETGRVEQSRIEENSGMDFSRRHPRVFWTLNDANNSAEIFAVGLDGADHGVFSIQGAENQDWEDIAVGACPHAPSKDCIFIADFGNNKLKRDDFTIYVVEEPARLGGGRLRVASETTFTVGGAHNFEALALVDGLFYLFSKGQKKSDTPKGMSHVFTLAPGAEEAEWVGEIDFNQFPEDLSKDDMTVTSADYDGVSGSLVLGTYGQAFQVALTDLEDFNDKATVIPMPEQEKSEAISFLRDGAGLSLVTSSEGLGQPIYRIGCGR